MKFKNTEATYKSRELPAHYSHYVLIAQRKHVTRSSPTDPPASTQQFYPVGYLQKRKLFLNCWHHSFFPSSVKAPSLVRLDPLMDCFLYLSVSLTEPLSLCLHLFSRHVTCLRKIPLSRLEALQPWFFECKPLSKYFHGRRAWQSPFVADLNVPSPALNDWADCCGERSLHHQIPKWVAVKTGTTHFTSN